MLKANCLLPVANYHLCHWDIAVLSFYFHYIKKHNLIRSNKVSLLYKYNYDNNELYLIIYHNPYLYAISNSLS